MRRREFIALLGGAAATWPIAAHAQQTGIPVIGFLSSRSPGEAAKVVAAFQDGLSESGNIVGRNVTIEFRWAEGQYDRLPPLAADLVRRPVTIIAAVGGSVSAFAAKAATTALPIVFAIGDMEPVEGGLVASLNRPGGNITGVFSLNSSLGPKRLELLHEVAPKAAIIGMLVNPNYRDAAIQVRDAQAAAVALGLQLHVLRAGTEREIEAAFASAALKQASGLGFIDGRIEKMFSEGGDMFETLAFIISELRCELRKEFAEQVGQLRAELTISSAIAKGEIAEIKRNVA